MKLQANQVNMGSEKANADLLKNKVTWLTNTSGLC